MINRFLNATLLLCLFTHFQVSAADGFFDAVEWQLKKDKRGIQIYTGKIPGSPHKAIYSTMRFESTPKAVVALLLDFPNCRLWASMCKQAYVEEQISATESIVYGLNDLPFPARNRDSYSRVEWLHNAESGLVTMESEALSDTRFARKKGVVRITYAHASWRIVPLPIGPNGSKQVLVESFLHIDPNGSLPSWLSNLLAVDAPYKAMRKMRALLKTGKYDQTDVAFLPGHTTTKPSQERYD